MGGMLIVMWVAYQSWHKNAMYGQQGLMRIMWSKAF